MHVGKLKRFWHSCIQSIQDCKKKTEKNLFSHSRKPAYCTLYFFLTDKSYFREVLVFKAKLSRKHSLQPSPPPMSILYIMSQLYSHIFNWGPWCTLEFTFGVVYLIGFIFILVSVLEAISPPGILLGLGAGTVNARAFFTYLFIFLLRTRGLNLGSWAWWYVHLTAGTSLCVSQINLVSCTLAVWY